MSHTVFVDGVTLTAASWFNDIDTVAYTYFGNGTNLNSPTKVAVTLGEFSTSMKTPVIDVISAGTLSIGGTTATTLNLGRSGQLQTILGSLSFSTAVSKIIPGATSISHRNNADNADNLLISDAGNVTVRGTLTITGGIVAGGKTITSATEQVTTSGSQKDFTGIPSGVKRITVQFSHVGVAASAQFINVLIGDSGGIETTGYVSINSDGPGINVTEFGIVTSTHLDATYFGFITLTLENASTNTWVASGVVSGYDFASHVKCISIAGIKTLTGTLDRVRISTSSTFDNGAVNIMYE